jgi:hypothetical protein
VCVVTEECLLSTHKGKDGLQDSWLGWQNAWLAPTFVVPVAFHWIARLEQRLQFSFSDVCYRSSRLVHQHMQQQGLKPRRQCATQREVVT